ncbi:MAG TPA: hypothetical protein VD788_03195 [Candidatus Polarisedimenticolaceae bacterium]|nr:hypothetical protein [Candidatus Polarisedimenticolaceae bacterium]
MRSSARSCRAALVGGLLVGLLCAPAAGGPPPEADPLNHAYAVYLGSGLYVTGDRTVFVMRVAPTVRLRSEEEHPFGIRLRFATTLGFYDLTSNDLAEFDINQLGTFAFIPGVEFPIRMSDKWTLSPFIDFGPATDTSFHDVTLVVGIGLRSRAEFPTKRHLHLLWNQFIYARNSQTGVRASTDDYTVFRTDYELRGIVSYRLGQRAFDLGLLARSELFFDSVIVDLPLGEPVSTNDRWEIGFTTGSTRKWKHFNMVTSPRIGISYRFGDGASGVRLTVRFRN